MRRESRRCGDRTRGRGFTLPISEAGPLHLYLWTYQSRQHSSWKHASGFVVILWPKKKKKEVLSWWHKTLTCANTSKEWPHMFNSRLCTWPICNFFFYYTTTQTWIACNSNVLTPTQRVLTHSSKKIITLIAFIVMCLPHDTNKFLAQNVATVVKLIFCVAVQS